jgi:molecular chaperone Hsp33
MTRHKTAPTATAALGRTLLGAALLGAYRKEDEQIQIQFKGDGPLSGILAVADTKGQVKGRVGNPDADPPLRADGKLAVGAAVGSGNKQCTRAQQCTSNFMIHHTCSLLHTAHTFTAP